MKVSMLRRAMESDIPQQPYKIYGYCFRKSMTGKESPLSEQAGTELDLVPSPRP
jgi:hypothetical protein